MFLCSAIDGNIRRCQKDAKRPRCDVTFLNIQIFVSSLLTLLFVAMLT